MNILRWIARFICSMVIVILGTYTVIAICIAGFIVFGKLTPGQAMIFDTNTPTLIRTLIFIGVSSLVIAGCAVVRNKLSKVGQK